MATDGKLREASLDDNINESVDGELDGNFSEGLREAKIVSSSHSVCLVPEEKLIIDFHPYSRRMLPKITIITFAEILFKTSAQEINQLKQHRKKENVER